MRLGLVSRELVKAKTVFKTVSPGAPSVLVGEAAAVAKVAFTAIGLVKTARDVHRGKQVSEIVGERIAGKVIGRAMKPVSRKVKALHIEVARPKPVVFTETLETHFVAPVGPTTNVLKTRNWVSEPGRKRMIIVFHDAYRAGPHIDVHIGELSVVYRVKPDLYDMLKYNNKGLLTEASRKLIIEHVKGEIAMGARVPQNLDHTLDDARETWINGDPNDKSYGAGKTRQIVAESDIDVYKAHEDGPIEFFAPALNPHRALYLFKLYNGDEKRAPILIWGSKKHTPPKFEDRLHLRMIHPQDMVKLTAKADMATSTAKYDGASCYVVMTPKGTTVWSPRLSKKTGEQIEYTHKLDGIAGITVPKTMIAMGELRFRETSACGKRTMRWLSAAEVGGILNSQEVPNERIKPEIRLYRADKFDRVKISHQGFWTNREFQEAAAACDPEGRIKVAELMSPAKALKQGFEGVVVVPPGGSVNEGFKMKWWTDPHDWRIDAVDFKPGDKGGIAGIVRLTSLESGKTFNLGPGQIGTRALCEDMMSDPGRYIGTVLKVESRHGHEGRAAKALMIHPDKGLAPY